MMCFGGTNTLDTKKAAILDRGFEIAEKKDRPALSHHKDLNCFVPSVHRMAFKQVGVLLVA